MSSLLPHPLRMKQLFLFLAAAAALCPAQVPKPPWAGGAAPAKKSSVVDGPSSDGPSSNGPSSDAAQTPNSTFKVDVKLVNVFVTVTDDHGAPVGGLTKDNFQ